MLRRHSPRQWGQADPSARHRTRRVLALMAGVLPLLVACTGGGNPPTEAPSTPLASFATDQMTVARGEFCERIAEEAVTRALGAAAEKTSHYISGVPTQLESDLVDLSHEYGCVFGTPEATARAWVFAPPVSASRAQEAIGALSGMKRCVLLPDAPAFGQPSVALACGDQAKPTLWFAGLFGDAWLTCTLERALPGPKILDETGRWCVAVAQAAAE